MHGAAMTRGTATDQRKNTERFVFLDWARRALRNVEIVMPGNGILHQINLERMRPMAHVADGVACVDKPVGTNSRTTMIHALGILGWGVSGQCRWPGVFPAPVGVSACPRRDRADRLRMGCTCLPA